MARAASRETTRIPKRANESIGQQGQIVQPPVSNFPTPTQPEARKQTCGLRAISSVQGNSQPEFCFELYLFWVWPILVEHIKSSDLFVADPLRK